MTVKVADPAITQDFVEFNDSEVVAEGNSLFCGPKTYTIAPALSFLSISGTVLTLQTNNVADAGTTAVTLTVKLTNYPSITSDFTFNAQVTCELTSFTFSQAPAASTTIKVGIDAQPHDIPFTVV